MYSGGDSADAQSYTQWPLNPSTYQNMSNEQVDWAALAQQWIIMKEAGPPVPEPSVLPQNSGKKVRKDVVEAGEAPMDVENDDDQPKWNEGTGSEDSWKWQQNQPPWNWESSWNNSPANAPKAALLPTPSNYNQYNANVDNASDNSSYGFNTPTNYQSGYWTASGSAKVIKPHNKRYSKVNVPTTVSSSPSVPPKVVSLDAAKRKQLPAWIREGLEKMERDKLKQLDREREKQEKDVNDAKRKLYEQSAMEILKDTVKEQQIVKSKFDSGSEESEEDIEGRSLTPEPQPPPLPRKLTQEDMMVSVRRSMTEILLKVTNSEIYNLCKEELERFQKRRKASDSRFSAPSGANLSAKLGLGGYGESDSENSEADSSDDSDTELKDTIRRRKADFAKIERAIEDKLSANEKKDVSTVARKTASPTLSDDKESQVDAKSSGRRNSHEIPQQRKPSKRVSRKSSSSDTSSGKNHKSSTRRSRRSFSSSSSSRSRSRSRDRKTASRSYSRRSKSRSRSRRRRSRSESSSRSRSYRRSRSSRSKSRSRRSGSYSRRRRSTSRRRSDSSSTRTSHRRRRSRSYSSGRGKKSHRH